MKSKLLPALLIVLILLNGVLIFMLIKKPHQNRNNRPERIFLAEQLQFSEAQNDILIRLDNDHKENMNSIDYEIRTQKDILYNSFGNEKLNKDSLIHITGNLEVKKELEVFNFFNSVRKICTSEQQEKFDAIINKALKGGNQGPPRNGQNPPPRDGRIPPPR